MNQIYPHYVGMHVLYDGLQNKCSALGIFMFPFPFCLYNDEPKPTQFWGSQVLRNLVDLLKTRRLHPIIVSCQLRNNNVNSATT